MDLPAREGWTMRLTRELVAPRILDKAALLAKPGMGGDFVQGHDLKMSVAPNIFLTPPPGSDFVQGHDLKNSVARNMCQTPPQKPINRKFCVQ